MALVLRTTRDNSGAGPARSGTVKVMVVDDSITARTVMSRMIDSEADIAVVATASSAERALYELERSPVDVILLDLEMPGMGGLEALPRLLRMRHGTQVLVVSSLTQDGAEHTLSALSMGAADTMLKPRPGEFDDDYRALLLAKIRALGSRRTRYEPPAPRPVPSGRKRPRLIAIGASTGGIHAIVTLLRELPRQFALPILVTQHLPQSFMPVFARQLELASGRPTMVAHEGSAIRPDTILVAPGDAHIVAHRRNGGDAVSLSQVPAASGCMPSVDPMFTSLAENFDGHALGVVLSGMGRDGLEGARALVNAGGSVHVQDETSSAVWGMPGAVARAGLATEIAPPQALARHILTSAGAAAWT